MVLMMLMLRRKVSRLQTPLMAFHNSCLAQTTWIGLRITQLICRVDVIDWSGIIIFRVFVEIFPFKIFLRQNVPLSSISASFESQLRRTNWPKWSQNKLVRVIATKWENTQWGSSSMRHFEKISSTLERYQAKIRKQFDSFADTLTSQVMHLKIGKIIL